MPLQESLSAAAPWLLLAWLVGVYCTASATCETSLRTSFSSSIIFCGPQAQGRDFFERGEKGKEKKGERAKYLKIYPNSNPKP
jgi:hypothetical protein